MTRRVPRLAPEAREVLRAAVAACGLWLVALCRLAGEAGVERWRWTARSLVDDPWSRDLSVMALLVGVVGCSTLSSLATGMGRRPSLVAVVVLGTLAALAVVAPLRERVVDAAMLILDRGLEPASLVGFGLDVELALALSAASLAALRLVIRGVTDGGRPRRCESPILPKAPRGRPGDRDGVGDGDERSLQAEAGIGGTRHARILS